MGYAANTQVSIEKSKEEIVSIIRKYEAKRFVSGWDDNLAFVMFELNNKRCRFDVVMPNLSEFMETPTGRLRAKKEALRLQEQEIKRKWRSLALNIKAKFVAIEDGISNFDKEFMSSFVLSNNKTVYEQLQPQIDNLKVTTLNLLPIRQ